MPIALATIAQMFILCVNELDLSIGGFCQPRRLHHRDLAARHAAVRRRSRWPALIAAYAALGALIHLRNLPSIVVTLGMSFVWLGLAVLVLPTPGGKAPDWIRVADDAEAADDPVPDHRLGRDRAGRACRADALGLRHGAARRGRQPAVAGARRLVASARSR